VSGAGLEFAPGFGTQVPAREGAMTCGSPEPVEHG